MRKIIAVLVLAAVMLTGCTEERQAEETLINSVTESTSETTVTIAETETGSVTTIVTEPVTEKETTVVTEQEQEKEQFRVVQTGDCWRFFSLGDGIICVLSECLNFVDADTGEFLVSISIPDDLNTVGKVIKGSGDVLAKVICDGYDYSTTPPTYYADAIIVKDNYVYETIRKCESADISFEACGHNIAEWGLDIVDTDSGEVIVSGYTKEGDEYGFYTQWNEYRFDIDENRFVYRIGGYESLPGYGIYDFSTGTATTVPESRDLLPIGCHNGKIYSVKGAWDGWGSELYVTDLETLESEFFMDFPYELSINQMLEYSMPESGEFIVANKAYYSDDNDVYSAALYRINPDTAEIEAVIEIPDEYKCYNPGEVIDENTFAVIYTKADATILIDLAWTEIADESAIFDEFVETVRAAYVERVETGNYDILDEIEEFLGDPFYYGEKSYQSMGYCYMDIDSNGTEELIFGSIDPTNGGTTIYNVATVRDGKIFQPVEGWTRNSFWYCGDGVIGNYGSGGASHNIYNFYKYNDGELELIEAFNFDYDKTGEDYCFHIKAGQTEEDAVKISKEDRDKIVEEYGRIEIDLTPFIQ